MWYYLVGRYVKVGTRTNSCLILESIPRIGMYTSILGASAGEPLLFKNSKRKPKNISNPWRENHLGTITYIYTRAECYGSNPLSTY